MITETFSILGPIGTLPVAGILGFAVGWGTKKLAKIALALIGIGLAILLVLEYKKIIHTDWNMIYKIAGEYIQKWHLTSIGTDNPLVHIVTVVGVPSAGVFIGAMALGWYKG